MKPQKRVKVAGRNSTSRRLFAPIEPGKPHLVELRYARTKALRRAEMRRLDHCTDLDRSDASCISWSIKTTGRPTISKPRRVVARIYVDKQTLMRGGAPEILSHERTHAGVAWARFRGAKIDERSRRQQRGKPIGGRQASDDEELLCYAVGRLVQRLNNWLYGQGLYE